MGWEFVAAIGLLLQLTGIVGALFGLVNLNRGLFGHRPLPPLGFIRKVRQRLRLKSVAVTGIASIHLEGVTSRARGYVTRPRPSLAATRDVWADYWESRIAACQSQLTGLQEDLLDATTKSNERLDATNQSLASAVGELDRRWTGAVAGRDGSGLNIAWIGLLLTFTGTLLVGIADLAR